jgi:plasmid stabilization system protein ParE
MRYSVLFSDDAENDVVELLTYLLPVAGEQVARRYVDRLIDYCYSFETFPQRGVVSDQKQGLRLVGYRRKATIAFRVKDDTVIIARIFHRGRNVEFGDDGDDNG